jgi:hypothetical protein
MEELESVLSGALKFGDKQADQLIELSRLNARQRRVLWRALSLLRRGRRRPHQIAVTSRPLRIGVSDERDRRRYA